MSFSIAFQIKKKKIFLSTENIVETLLVFIVAQYFYFTVNY